MRKFLFVTTIALLGTLSLSACNNGSQQATTTQTTATRPSSSAVDEAIKACQAKHPKQAAPAPSTTAPAAAGTTAPALVDESSEEDDACARATIAASTWQAYLQHVVTENMQGVTSNPYVYFVPSSKFPENQGAIGRVQDSLDGTVAATVLPGNMVAVAGPDSATTAQALITAFKDASPGSFKGVTVLFIGDKADETAVQQALAPSGATFKFAQM